MKEALSFRGGIYAMDFKKVTHMLQGAYWCPGIGENEVVKAARHSALVVGAFLGESQVGYARVISDMTRFAYFMDVIVEEAHRGQGIGQGMVRYIMQHETLEDVYQWLLYTSYAHGMYEKLGFAPLPQPENYLAIRGPRPKR